MTVWKAIKIYFRILEFIYAIIGVVFTYVCLLEVYSVGFKNWIDLCTETGNELLVMAGISQEDEP